MNISEQIRNHRKKLGLTQEQVAAYMSVSAPAVNKWEKGNTYPEVTLLPALARLLKIDMNELFSFREELTEFEIGQFANELVKVAMAEENIATAENITTAFEMAAAKIQEYPRCDPLIYMAATTLDGVLVLSDIPDAHKERYQKTVFGWLEQASGSADTKIRYPVVYLLAAKYMQMEDYEKAKSFLEQIPDTPIDKTLLQTRLLLHEQDHAAAAVFLEGNLLRTIGNVQNYLLLLLEIEEQDGQRCEAEKIAEISEQLCSLCGLWPYGAVVPRLLIALFRQDTEQSIRLIKAAFEESQKPWDMGASPLYYRYPQKSSNRIGKSFARSFLSEIRKKDEYGFLRGNTELEKILEQYEEIL